MNLIYIEEALQDDAFYSNDSHIKPIIAQDLPEASRSGAMDKTAF